MPYHQYKQRTNRSIGCMCTSIMEHSQPQSESEEEMSFEQKISQNTRGDGHSLFRSQTFGQGLFTKGGGPAFPPQRLVILCLALLNAVLLIAAVVLGIYCVTFTNQHNSQSTPEANGNVISYAGAKAKDLQVPHSVASPLIVELNYLRNQSDIVKDKLEAQAALVREQASHLQLKMQVKQQKTISDGLQRKIETLQTEKTKLQTNKTSYEESCGRCPSGWILLKTSCYYFSKRESGSRKNWQDSRADCVSQGGDLLVINNLEEQQLMSDNFPKLSSSSNLWWMNGFWIGLTDVVTEGTWIWINNVTETETMYWRHGQPNHIGSQSGNCAAFYYYHEARSTWYNGKCHELQLNWICEMEPR